MCDDFAPPPGNNIVSAKDIARSLGLLRKRSSSCSHNLRKKCKQNFDYLIVLDFESTCWKDTKTRPQEIIEFPAVLLNTASGQIEREFQQYVIPMEYPTLSAFCTELTGISQVQIEDGVPLNLCLRRFINWLKKVENDFSVNFEASSDLHSMCGALVTWSDWDLGVCLLNECKRKQIRKSTVFNQWIDLRLTYKNFYARKPNGLNGALKDLGLEFQGREHCGLEDARNTAKLAYRMMCDGCIMQITKSLSSVTTAKSSTYTTLKKENTVEQKDTSLIKSSHTSILGITVNESFQTPTNGTMVSKARKTPPMCQCGRRAKRRMSQTPGPNMGRIFFSCGQNSRDKRSSCGFFKWEDQTTLRLSLGDDGGYSPRVCSTKSAALPGASSLKDISNHCQ